jgi:hypothetical protein
MNKRWPIDRPLTTILLLALAVRLLGIGFGFPNLVFADESHHVNVAMSFGSGHLNPHIFKYPTLWMYVLFALYGIYFLLWSGFGLLHSPMDFAGLFAWKAWTFYLLARVAAAVSGVALPYFVYQSALKLYRSKRAAILSASLAAFSPDIVFFAKHAKPDTLMLSLVAAALYALILYQEEMNTRNLYLGACLFGLACSTQYTAGLAVPYLFLVAMFTKEPLAGRLSIRLIRTFKATTLLFTAFFLGSPFTLIDRNTFWGDLASLRSYGTAGLGLGAGRTGFLALRHFCQCLGPTSWGGFLLVLLLLSLLRWPNRKTLLLLVPVIAGVIFLACQSRDAAPVNYAFCLFPFLFLAMGALGAALENTSGPLALVIMGALTLPNAIEGARVAKYFLVKDTRLQASQWIASNIRSGSTLLLDQPYAGPTLFPTKEQAERLLEKNKERGNIRWRYFEALLRRHPGGGYRILRVDRNWKEALSPLKRQTEAAHDADEWLDVEKGIDVLKKAGVDYVVWSSAGSTRANMPRLSRFFDDLESNVPLVKEFDPQSPYSPIIRIYAVSARPKIATK